MAVCVAAECSTGLVVSDPARLVMSRFRVDHLLRGNNLHTLLVQKMSAALSKTLLLFLFLFGFCEDAAMNCAT